MCLSGWVSMSCWSLYRHYDVTCDAKNKNLKESNKIAKEKKNDAVRRSWFHVGKSPKRAFTRFRKILHSWVMLTWHVGAQKCSDFTAATADVSASEAGDHIHRRLRRRPHFLTPKYLYTFANLQNTTFLKVNKYIYIFFKNKVISFFFVCLWQLLMRSQQNLASLFSFFYFYFFLSLSLEHWLWDIDFVASDPLPWNHILGSLFFIIVFLFGWMSSIILHFPMWLGMYLPYEAIYLNQETIMLLYL